MKESLKWALVATSTFLIDNVLFSLSFYYNKNVFVSNFFSYVMATAFNFVMHKTWTFRSNMSFKSNLSRYLLLVFSMLIINTTFVYFLVSYSIAPNASKFVSAVISIPINYAIAKKYVFI